MKVRKVVEKEALALKRRSSVDMQGAVINYLVVILIELRQWATLWLFECVQQLLDLCRHLPSTEMWEVSVRKLRWGTKIFSSYNHHHHQNHPHVHHHHHRCDRHLVVPCDDSLSERWATCPYLQQVTKMRRNSNSKEMLMIAKVMRMIANLEDTLTEFT